MAHPAGHPWRADRHMGARAPIRGSGRGGPLPPAVSSGAPLPGRLEAGSRSRAALERLIDRHGRGNYADHTLKLTFPRNPNGLYLLKGGGPDVWQAFGVPMSWRKRQGLIVGKRCGTTENIGPAARQRLAQQAAAGGGGLRAALSSPAGRAAAADLQELRRWRRRAVVLRRAHGLTLGLGTGEDLAR